MTAGEDLLSHLVHRIRREGPITFAAFMAESLYHPSLGRYSRSRPPMGFEGDYVTSPEVDEAFGRLLGRAIADMADRLPASRAGEGVETEPFTIVEMGPGRGTLCRDLLRSLSEEHPGLSARLRYVLVESSASLRREQASVLAEAAGRDQVAWRSWSDLRRGVPLTGCLIANEFLDALPVHLVEWSGGRVREVHVTVGEDGALRETLGDPSSDAVARYFDDLDVRLAEGQRAEVNLEANRWIAEAASLLQRGYVIIIDYGHDAEELFSERHFAGTLLGYRRHALVTDPLAAPGEHDLTSHVDFTSVVREARRHGFETAPRTSQRKLLIAMGLAQLIADLAQAGEPAEAAERVSRRFALHALMSPSGMGETFKVLVLGRRAPLEGLRCLVDPFRGAAVEARAPEG